MKTILEPFGYRLNTAASVQEAMLAFRETNPDLIVTDVHLADGSGFQLLQHIRTDARLRATPVIVLSGSADATDVRKALEAGAVKFLRRPIEPEVLLAEISAVLKSARREANGDHTCC